VINWSEGSDGVNIDAGPDTMPSCLGPDSTILSKSMGNRHMDLIFVFVHPNCIAVEQ
jgi:hypothetical protein